ncbi:MAG: hypothetical protein ACRDU5_12715 [Mycobacterium sp.]
MSDVNWWLMALAFVLGLVLTLAFTIRRVKREVPEYAGGGGGGATQARSLTGAADVDAPATAKTPTAGAGAPGGASAAAGAVAATAAGGAAAAKSTGDKPYGEGSVRVAATATAPSGYTVKGNEDSMLYHTPESPSYKQTIAEIWFRDVETAEGAGFARWDSGKSQRGQR